MNQDHNGHLLKIGDIVNIPCRIIAGSDDPVYNATVETIHVMPGTNLRNTVALNTTQVVFLSPDEPPI